MSRSAATANHAIPQLEIAWPLRRRRQCVDAAGAGELCGYAGLGVMALLLDAGVVAGIAGAGAAVELTGAGGGVEALSSPW